MAFDAWVDAWDSALGEQLQAAYDPFIRARGGAAALDGVAALDGDGAGCRQS